LLPAGEKKKAGSFEKLFVRYQMYDIITQKKVRNFISYGSIAIYKTFFLIYSHISPICMVYIKEVKYKIQDRNFIYHET